ncbi:MAG TPA: YqaA family protein [Bacteroidales bacterium]|jgi:membrane protein YqaA with SNARE-associated domain|nr:YqaA family protein [Bacteroidales bacterium]
MYAYILLFIWCFTASSIIPVSSEPYFTTLIITKQVWLPALIIASIGNILGSITTYWLGKKAGEIGIHKLHEKHKKRVIQAQHIVHKYGTASLFFAWVPIIGDIIVTIAGTLQTPLVRSIIWISAGKIFRYSLITAITLHFI